MNSPNNLLAAFVLALVGTIVGATVEGLFGETVRQSFQAAIDANPENNAVPLHNLSILMIDLAPLEGLVGGGLWGYFAGMPQLK